MTELLRNVGPANDLRLGNVLDEDRQVAHLAGRRGNPLGHLGLEHEDEA